MPLLSPAPPSAPPRPLPSGSPPRVLVPFAVWLTPLIRLGHRGKQPRRLLLALRT